MNPQTVCVFDVLVSDSDIFTFLLNHWKKDPLVENREDKNTLDLMLKVMCCIV